MNYKTYKTKKTNVKVCILLLLYFFIFTNYCSAQFSFGPKITTNNATDITDKKATLQGYVENADEASVSFRYSTKQPSYSSWSFNDPCSQINEFETGTIKVPAQSRQNVNFTVYNLSPNTKYYFCAAVSGFSIKKYGEVKSFTTEIYIPTTERIFTKFATEVKETEAVLSGTINSKTEARAYFRYSPARKPPVFCNDIYGSNMVATRETTIPSNTSTDISLKITSLLPGTKYYFCIVSSTQKLIEYGEVKSFTTDPSPLIDITDTNNNSNYITTNRISVVDANSVYLNGAYNILPLFSGAETYFLYKKVDEPESQNKKVGLASRASGAKGTMSFLVKDISPNISYQVQAVLKTSDMVRIGNTINFMTSGDGTIGPGTNFGNGTTTGSGTGTGTGTTTGTSTGTGTGEPSIGNYYIGQKVTPPSDAVVRYHEGIETVFSRQIKANTELAKIYGYEDGMNLETFSWTIADQLAKAFGYVSINGREIRVSKPDIAAYQLYVNNGILIVYEYFDSVIVNIQKTSPTLRDRYDYEYYFK